MLNRGLIGACLFGGSAALLGAAHAAVIPVNCAVVGQKIATALVQAIDGDTIAVSGTCVENIVVVRDGITIAKSTAATAAGIRGQVEVVGRRVVISLLSILGPEPLAPAGQILSAGVWARDGASVFLDRIVVTLHTVDGILANRNASVLTDRVKVLSNAGDGVVALDGATIRLDTQVTTLASSVTNNKGSGVVASRGGSVSILGVTTAPSVISGNGGSAVVATDGASVRIVHASISAPAGQMGVLAAQNSVTTVEASVVTALDRPAILANDNSTATIRGTAVTSAADSSAGGTVGALRASTVRLLGGNTISNTAATVPGGNLHPALEAFNMGNLRADDGTGFGFASATDTISGATDALLVGNLSTADLHQGAMSGDVTVSQRGTLRLTKTGALPLGITGNILLVQGSAGFFAGTAGSIFTSKPVSCGDTESSIAGATVLSSGAPISCTGF